MPECKFPTCTRHAEPNGYCIGHKMYASFTPVKVPAPPPKKSDTRKEQEKQYKKLVVKIIHKAGGKCQIKSPVCTGKAQGLNHKKGREGENYLNEEFLEAACNACNLYIEENPVWGEETGHKISKHKISEP